MVWSQLEADTTEWTLFKIFDAFANSYAFLTQKRLLNPSLYDSSVLLYRNALKLIRKIRETKDLLLNIYLQDCKIF